MVKIIRTGAVVRRVSHDDLPPSTLWGLVVDVGKFDCKILFLTNLELLGRGGIRVRTFSKDYASRAFEELRT